MSIAILLRRSAALNQFRDIIIRSLSSGLGTEATLCSGFFQEGRGAYRATREPGFIAGIRRLSSMKTLGVHNWSWLADYRAFATAVRAAGASIDARRVSGMRWHAKIYILKQKGRPFLAVIGSSNITGPAFGTRSMFNRECDVVLWTGTKGAAAADIRRLVQGDHSGTQDLILTRYNPKDNAGLTIQQRLDTLNRDLESIPSTPLE